MPRAFVLLLLAAACAAGSLVFGSGPARPVCAMADGLNHVAVVARHSDSRTISRCVGFPGSSITAEQALNASGLERAYYGYGGGLGDGVCQVDNEPATPPGGFTRTNCLYSGGGYWATLVARRGGAWSTTPKGVSNTSLADGDAAGFDYGDGTEPPPPLPGGICPPAASTPQPTAPATATARTRAPVVVVRPVPSPSPTSLDIAAASPAVPAAPATPIDLSSREKVAVAVGRSAQPAARPGWSPGWVSAGAAATILLLMLLGQLARGRLGR